MHNKEVRQLHTCQGREKKDDAVKTHIQNICTHNLKNIWEFCQRNEGEKIKYKQTVDCRVRKYCHKENRSAKKSLTLVYIREHKAYTYVRIYTKQKNACIVYYVAVFLGYQVQKKKEINIKTLVEIFSHMPIMYKVTLDMAGLYYD